MTWFIDDYNEYQIYITDLWREFYLPKFNDLYLVVNEPYLEINWMDTEKGGGGENRQLIINYLDVVDGYSGYISNPSSAQDLKDQIDAMRVSAFSGGGSILTAKADLLSHDGVSDTILPGGANEFILSRDNTEATGLKWISKAVTVDNDTVEGTGIGSSPLVAMVRQYHICAITSWNPLDGTTVFFNGTGNVVNTGSANLKNIIMPACTIIEVDIIWNATGVAGSNENIPLQLRFNDTTDIAIATIGNTAAVKRFTIAGLSQVMNGSSDFVCFKIVCPTWATNPTAVGFQGFIKYRLS